MKKLKVKKGSTCMACLECVRACSESFYKEFDPDKSCIQIVEKKSVRPMACPQCGKCAEACPEGAITQNPKGVYMINKKTLRRQAVQLPDHHLRLYRKLYYQYANQFLP